MRGPVHQSETNSTHTAAIRWKNRKFGARLPQGRSACSWKCPGKNIIVEWALMEMAMDFYLLSTHNICCRPLPFFSTFGVNHLVQISRKCLGKICKSCSELSGFFGCHFFQILEHIIWSLFCVCIQFPMLFTS